MSISELFTESAEKKYADLISLLSLSVILLYLISALIAIHFILEKLVYLRRSQRHERKGFIGISDTIRDSGDNEVLYRDILWASTLLILFFLNIFFLELICGDDFFSVYRLIGKLLILACISLGFYTYNKR